MFMFETGGSFVDILERFMRSIIWKRKRKWPLYQNASKKTIILKYIKKNYYTKCIQKTIIPNASKKTDAKKHQIFKS